MMVSTGFFGFLFVCFWGVGWGGGVVGWLVVGGWLVGGWWLERAFRMNETSADPPGVERVGTFVHVYICTCSMFKTRESTGDRVTRPYDPV